MIRCKIVDIAGQELLPGIIAKTPPQSRAHIGKLGTVIDEEYEGWTVKILLDDGNVLCGYDCWWEEIDDPPPGCSEPKREELP